MYVIYRVRAQSREVEGETGIIEDWIGWRARYGLPFPLWRSGHLRQFGDGLVARALGGGRRTALRALWSIDLRLMSMCGWYSS
jgi:hypothetical protein